MLINKDSKVEDELEAAMQYFNYATEEEHIDKAIEMINIAEEKRNTKKTD